jgi:molybdopterin molybdotransferase
MGANVKRVKMAATPQTSQTIARLTPLAEVLALIDRRVQLVAPSEVDANAAAGRVLGADAVAPARPQHAIALIDGWALRAEDTSGAGGYAPALLPQPPQRVDAGEPMPAGTDSVAPLDAVSVTGGRAEAFGALAPGEGVLPAGGDCGPDMALRRAGERVSVTHIAAFAAAGLVHVILREPRLAIVSRRADRIVAAAASVIARDIERQGGTARVDDSGELDRVLRDDAVDAVAIIGGTGSGRNDASVQILARMGEIAVHGVAVSPGDTAALGFVGAKPVLLLPGRLDAALSVWLVIGRHVLARLAGGDASEPTVTMVLARKVTSTVGLAEVVPVRRSGDGVEPLAAKYLPLSALARADGWILVPAESEGYPARTGVAVRAWP